LKAKKNSFYNIILSAVMLIFLFVLIIDSAGLRAGAVRLPLLVAWVTVAMIVIQIALEIKKYRAIPVVEPEKKEVKAEPEDPEDPEIKVSAREHFLKIVCSIGFMMSTLVLWYLFGFLPALLISSISFAFYLGERRPVPVILTCVCVTAAMYGLFAVLLKVPIPQGIVFGGYWG
jgi:magnesium-transporting ATPase (P-type)